MSLSDVREGLAQAIKDALSDHDAKWIVMDYEPAQPDVPCAIVRFPINSARTDFKGSITYDLPVSFLVGLADDKTATTRLNPLFDGHFWRAIERYEFQGDQPYRSVDVVGSEGVSERPVGASVGLAVDLMLRIVT